MPTSARREAVVLDGFLEEGPAGLSNGGGDSIGTALSVAQFGGKHPAAKPWKGEGPGVLEVVEDHAGDTYRTVYTVRFRQAAYVLHAFQKKSPRGIRTARPDVELVLIRLKQAQKDYQERYANK